MRQYFAKIKHSPISIETMAERAGGRAVRLREGFGLACKAGRIWVLDSSALELYGGRRMYGSPRRGTAAALKIELYLDVH